MLLNFVGEGQFTRDKKPNHLTCVKECINQAYIFYRFDGLECDTEYTISVSTELDGKTITQVNLVALKGKKKEEEKPKKEVKEETKKEKKKKKK